MVAEILDVQGKALTIFALAALGQHDSLHFMIVEHMLDATRLVLDELANLKPCGECI